jgi:hypothetical protein
VLGARVVSNFSGKKDDAGVIDEEDKRSGIRFIAVSESNDNCQILHASVTKKEIAHRQRWGRLPTTQTHPSDLFYILSTSLHGSANAGRPSCSKTHWHHHLAASGCTHLHNYARPLSFISVSSHMCFVDLRSQEYTREPTRQPEDHVH